MRRVTSDSGRVLLVAAVASLLCFAGTGTSQAQLPDQFTNLQILSKEIGQRELVGIMRDWAGALGVRCNHCHVGPDNLQGMDFATDEKATKKTARTMMKMVENINTAYVSKVESGRSAKLEVQCQSCHRGVAVPAPVDLVVEQTIESDGVAAALKRYRELREEYYGKASYDFSATPLNSLAQRLAMSEKSDAALTMLETNIEFHPEDSATRTLLGGLYAQRGEKSAAIAAFKKALELDPENRWAKRQLASLEAPEE